MQPPQPPLGEVSNLDLISELKFRRWARVNYVATEQRDPDWHPVVLEEMQRKDQELELDRASRA